MSDETERAGIDALRTKRLRELAIEPLLPLESDRQLLLAVADQLDALGPAPRRPQEPEIAVLTAALQRIEDGDDCRCEHDDENCCANVTDFCCPGCIAHVALNSSARRPQEVLKYATPEHLKEIE